MSLSNETIKEDSKQPPSLSNLMEDVFRLKKENLYKITIKILSFAQNHWLGGHSDPTWAAEEAILSYIKLSS